MIELTLAQAIDAREAHSFGGKTIEAGTKDQGWWS